MDCSNTCQVTLLVTVKAELGKVLHLGFDLVFIRHRLEENQIYTI